MTIEREPTKDLFVGLLSDAKELAAGHLGRLQSEISDEFTNLRNRMLRIAVAVGIVVVGAVLAGHMLAAALVALGVPVWASYGIAALLMIAIGLVLAKRLPGTARDADLVPEASLAGLRRDFDQVSHAVRGTDPAPRAVL